jgi:hypothetical protein
VIELITDRWACWRFGHLAAIRGLRYDRIVGQQFEMSVQVDACPWKISAFYVIAAVAIALDR